MDSYEAVKWLEYQKEILEAEKQALGECFEGSDSADMLLGVSSCLRHLKAYNELKFEQSWEVSPERMGR